MSEPDPLMNRTSPSRERRGPTSGELVRSATHSEGPSATAESEAARRRRRASFLAELAEARELRDRDAPRRARVARLRAELRRRTFLI